ncbi:MAG: radical SAM protein [Candidatus Omnitrophota bacterium]|nr:radical SAM protein [Candidatus Omnitrophota bacterium]
MSYFYGPVPSRRLGFSLGVNLLPKKICTFDCIYCQLGKTNRKSIKRFNYVDSDKFKKALKKIISKHPKIDYITISGCGEPTLHKNLDRIILVIRKVTQNKYPICVITNSSLLYRKDVRQELFGADLLMPSLDAFTPRLFRKIDRPHRDITIHKIVDGLAKLRKEFKGKIWLEIMLVGGINDTLAEARKLKKVIIKINPDKVQLNLPVRPSGSRISLPSYEKIKNMIKIIGPKVEVVHSFYKHAQRRFSQSIKQDITKFLKIRPATLEDLAKSSGITKKEMREYIRELLAEKSIIENIHNKKVYFTAALNND